MSLPSVSPQMVGAGTNRFLSRYISTLGISLSEMDYLRGHKDDFLGDAIRDEYDQEFAGAGSTITLMDARHGGWIFLRSGDDPGRYSRLWLGAAAGGYNTLDADEGWVQIARIEYDDVTDVIFWTGAALTPVAGNRYILCGLDTATSANYRISCGDGANSQTDSGVAADTDPHWHVIDVYPITGGRQVDYYLDARLIASQTTNVPTEVLTPILMTYSVGATVERGYWDYWAVIPR